MMRLPLSTPPRRSDHRRDSSRHSPANPRRARKRETAKSLGVYDADRDILDQYLYEVSKTPLLTQPQEVAIARKVRTGDEEAMQELVKRNSGSSFRSPRSIRTAGSRSPT